MNKFFIVAIIFWGAMIYYNLIYTFDLMAAIVATTWLVLNVLILADEKREKSIYPKKLSRRQIKELSKMMPKGRPSNEN